MPSQTHRSGYAQNAVSRQQADATRRRRRRFIQLIRVTADAAMILLAGLVTNYVFFVVPGDHELGWAAVPDSYWTMALAMVFVWPIFLSAEKLYDSSRLYKGSGEMVRTVRAMSSGLLGLIVAAYLVQMPYFAREWLLLFWGTTTLFVCAMRLSARPVVSRLRARGFSNRTTLIIGCNDEAKRLALLLLATPSSGLVPIGALTGSDADDCGEELAPSVPVVGSSDSLRAAVEASSVSSVIIAGSAFTHRAIARMINDLRDLPVAVHISSGLFEVLTQRVVVREVAGVPLITVAPIIFSRFDTFRKRSFDILVAGVIIVFGLPLWLLIAVMIKLDSRGPVLFRQPRVGRDGAVFPMYKFRTMVDDADSRLDQLSQLNEADGPLFKIKGDPRITRVGAYLRRFSLDEFPQLINVVQGHMSLVGPRPPLLVEAEAYTSDHWKRMEVLPGMTGLWQVSGRSNLTFDEMVRLDLYYIENWSISFDMAILVRTIPAVLLARGAY